MQTFHRFLDQAAFFAACDAVGWARDPMGNVDHPPGVSLDIIGPYAPRPTVVNGVPIAGTVDPRWHVNVLWPGDDVPPPAWEAARISPATPDRGFAVRPTPGADPPSVPDTIAAWRLRLALRDANKMAAAKTAVQGLSARNQDIWDSKPEWRRNSTLITGIATAMSLTPAEMDQLFINANAIAG